jgi:GTP-binding protein HflX
MSARTGAGVEDMIQELEHQLSAWRLRASYRIPVKEAALVAEIHRVGHVLDLHYEEDFVLVRAHVPPELQGRLAHYQVTAAGAEVIGWGHGDCAP